MGYKIPRESWRIIEVVIRRYPENKAAYDNAIEAQKKGDWAGYGKYMDELEKYLNKLAK